MSRHYYWPEGRIGRRNRTVRLYVAAWVILLPALACAQTYNISLFAGTAPVPPALPTAGFAGDGGQALSAQLAGPTGIWLDSSQNVYIVDKDNDRIRKVTPNGIISTVAGSSTAEVYAGDGGKATSASLNQPNGIAFDSAGNMYIADTGNQVIRMVNPSGIISTVAGNNASAYSGDGGPATDASLSEPTSVAFDAAGNLYIADSNNDCIRIVTPDKNIHTFAGQCSYPLYQGDGGPATQAKLNKPYSIAVDNTSGNVYFSDTENERLRVVTPNGIINTVAGNGTAGFNDGPALQAEFSSPSGIALDASGSIYIADKSNFRIRKLLPSGNVVTVAGNGIPGYSGNGSAATGAEMYFPVGVFADNSGDVYIADTQNDLVRELTVSSASSLPAVSKGGVTSAYQFGALASPAPGSWIEIYGSNLATDSRAWATTDFNGNNAPTALDGTSVTIGGQPAYVEYISPGQVNVQVPSTAPTGTQPVVVTVGSNVSQPQTIAIGATAPGFWAPASLAVGGNQYVGALFPDFATFVLPPGAVSGDTSQRAQPGDTIILYGIGFGPVTTNLPAGQIAQGLGNTLPTGSFQIFFDGTPATVKYAGLTPGSVGLYQFNVVVPNVAANDLTPVTFKLGGVAGTQTLYTAIGN
ncbi:MAG: IPT/TIG domain-containing protein [Bryobacteraceae bacterium]